MLKLIKPAPLRSGDRVAAVSPSWGGPSVFRARYAAGKRQFENLFGVTVVEMPHTLAPPEYLVAHPEARAADLMQAFADPEIAGIVSTIGGDDSTRLLPHLDLSVINKNPKVFIGFSDTTALHLACFKAGLGTFYGPSIMAGFAENGGMHRLTSTVAKEVLARTEAIGLLPANSEGWVAGPSDWGSAAIQNRTRALHPPTPPRMLQGQGQAVGHLLGGCAEVLEMTKGTAWWPALDQWRGAILFYETSEDAPPPQFIRYWLRNFAAQGILQVLNGILIARADPGEQPDYQNRLETAFVDVLEQERLSHLPVLSGLDFGHTQPMLTLPYGAQARIDCTEATLEILEAGVSGDTARHR